MVSPRIKPAAEVLGLPEEKLIEVLQAIGVEPEDYPDEDIFRFNDFQAVLPSGPIAKARKAYKILREGGTSGVTGVGLRDARAETLKALGVKTKIENIAVAQLLEIYDPTLASDPVTAELKRRYKDDAVIAFRSDGKVAVAETAQYLADLEQAFPPCTTLNVDGQLVRLQMVGQKPDTMIDEDPLFPGSPLRNNYSIVNHRNWIRVTRVNRQFCRIVVERGEIDTSNNEAVLRLIERATGGAGNDESCPLATLCDAYPEAELEFRERKQRDELPKLKMVLGEGAKKPNNPFGVSKKY